jgi:hypothetical protein
MMSEPQEYHKRSFIINYNHLAGSVCRVSVIVPQHFSDARLHPDSTFYWLALTIAVVHSVWTSARILVKNSRTSYPAAFQDPATAIPAGLSIVQDEFPGRGLHPHIAILHVVWTYQGTTAQSRSGMPAGSASVGGGGCCVLLGIDGNHPQIY